MNLPVSTTVMALIITTYTFCCAIVIGIHLKKSIRELKRLREEQK